MSDRQQYTINEVAALTGRHPNTIRQKIKTGVLEASVFQGKFGEEYRITREALLKCGILSQNSPLEDGAAPAAVLNPEVRDEPPAETNGAVVPAPTLAALGELYQRHEQAMFRLGYMQGELERLKALEATAESLRQDRVTQDQEVQGLRATLEEKERQAAEAEALRLELQRARERLQEMESLRRDLDHLKALADVQQQLIDDRKQRAWWQFWRG